MIDQTSIATTTVHPVADLALDVTSTPTVIGGETAVVTYTVYNNGPSTALNTIITATFPASATAPAGWTLVGGNVYTYAVGDVPAGGTVIVRRRGHDQRGHHAGHEHRVRRHGRSEHWGCQPGQQRRQCGHEYRQPGGVEHQQDKHAGDGECG